MGADLRDRRGVAAGAAGVPGNLQHHLAGRTPRVPQPGRISPATASIARSGGVGFNPVSQKPQAVQEHEQIARGDPVLEFGED
jgi:hypothetical protein